MARVAKVSTLMWPGLFRRFAGADGLQGQLRDMLVHVVLEGLLLPGAALPSVRNLAQTLGVSRTTVTLALQAVVDRGFIEARQRSGYFVAARVPEMRQAALQRAAKPAPAGTSAWRGRLQLQPSMQRNIDKPRDWQQYPYPFIYGQFDASLFPFRDWRACVLETLQAKAVRSWATDHIDGDDALLVEQIQQRLLPSRGIWARNDEILVTSGAQQATYLLAQLLIGAATQVGIESPGYPDARNNFALRTRRLKALPVDGEGLIVGAALAQCDYVYVTPSHQCPTTVTMPLERRMALLARANQDNFFVIEDDHESELNFLGQPTPALKSLDSAGRVLYVGSLSKTLAHGLRLGYLVAPAALVRELRALRRLMMRHVSTNNQQAAAFFIAHGHQESFVRKLNAHYRERATCLRQALQRHLPELQAAPAQGGSALWVRAADTLDTRALAGRLLEKGVIVEPGDVFFPASRQPCCQMRIGYSSISTDRIEAGVMEIARVMRGDSRLVAAFAM